MSTLWFQRLFSAPRLSRRSKSHRVSPLPAWVETLESRTLLTQFIAVGTDAGVQNEVRILADNDRNGTYETQTTPTGVASFNPFGAFTGGVRVAFGDFNGDQNGDVIDEIAVAAGPGGGPHVIIYQLTSGGVPGAILDSFFAYGAGFTGGVFIASGDLDGDGRDELITAPDAGGGPHVRIFSDTDGDGLVSDNPTDNLFPYPGFSGGVRVATGDVNNNGRDELITAPGPGGGPEVVVFRDSDRDGQVSDNSVLDRFLAYSPSFTGGVYVASSSNGINSAGNGGAEIITGPGAGGGPHVRIFTDSDNDGRVSDNPTFEEINPVYPGFTGGVRVAAGNTDRSESGVEVLTVPGPGGGANLKIFDDNGDSGPFLSDNALDDNRLVFPGNNTAGFFVATGEVQTSVFAFAGPAFIPDSGSGEQSYSIFVPSSAGIIRDLDVHLSIDHTFNADLIVGLLAPNGQFLQLFSNVGGNGDGIFVRLSDESGTDIGSLDDQVISGQFNPEGGASLSVFDGLDASGEWQLRITDTASSDTGILLNWLLEFDHEFSS